MVFMATFSFNDKLHKFVTRHDDDDDVLQHDLRMIQRASCASLEAKKIYIYISDDLYKGSQ